MHDCSSPFIVSFYGAYLQDPHICMCMEYMDKGCACATLRLDSDRFLTTNLSEIRSLDSIYRRIGPIPEPVIGKIALAVVSGLTYLYEVHKIMHRGTFVALGKAHCAHAVPVSIRRQAQQYPPQLGGPDQDLRLRRFGRAHQ